MKAGRSLQEVIERVHKTKKDFVADTRSLEFASDKHGSILTINGADEPGLAVSRLAHTQIADRLKIPQAFYDRLGKDHPQILDQNVNGLFGAEPERRMVRALDGRVRAFLASLRSPRRNRLVVMRTRQSTVAWCCLSIVGRADGGGNV